MKTRVVRILFIHTFLYADKTKEISSSLHDFNHFYEFEVKACPEIPSQGQIARANIIICNGSVFAKQHVQIKELLKANPRVWVAVRSYTHDLMEKAKKLGARHVLTNNVDGVTDARVIYDSVVREFLNSNNVLAGAGFNN